MDDNTNILLNIVDLDIGYVQQKKAFPVFQNINITAIEGELIGLIGRNGIGKSTLLRSIARINRTIQGNIYLRSKSIYEYKLKNWAKELSFVSTEPVKIQNLTVKELVTLGRYPYTNWAFNINKHDEDIIEKSISLVNISHLKNKNIDEISDGERQRAMIARTLAQDTDVILLDEPTAFLDLPNKYEIIHLLNNLARNENKTILFSSHDLTIALSEADKIWLMENDTIYEGAPEDLVLKGIFGHLFDDSGIVFDINTGDIKLKNKKQSEIYVQGHGPEYNWTIKALDRMGYNVSENKELPLKVFITSENNTRSWELYNNNEKIVFNSIYKLTLRLKHIIKSINH